MWRYLQNVQKPEAKNKQSDAEKRKYYQDYDKIKRQRKFQSDWGNGRPWLTDTENGLVCAYCNEFCVDRSLQFIVGCTSYKLDSVIKHEKSNQHQRSAALTKAKETTKADSAAGKIIQTLNNHIIDKMCKMFRNCHALVLHNRPFSDFVWLCDLDEAKGAEVGNIYRTAEYCKTFVKSIAEVEYFQVKQSLESAKFYCVIGDGTTDSSVKEQEMWFCRTCTGGDISVWFIGVHAPERANAEGIVGALKHVVKVNLQIEWTKFVSKLAALACDGASVMVGAKSGVGTILQNEQPSLITIHCMAHRLELCLKDSSKKIKLYDRSISVLAMGLYYFYHNSALNRSMLMRAFSALSSGSGKERLLLPTRVGGTRWIGHTFRALVNLITAYRYIMGHLSQLTEAVERVSVDSKAKAVAFLRLLRCKDVLCFLHFLLDVLSPLKRLSKLLQERTCVLAKQQSEISSTLEVIRKYKTEEEDALYFRDGTYLRKVVDVELTQCNAAEFGSVKGRFLEQIEQALEKKRFAEFSSSSVISCTRIGNIQSWPKSWDELRAYGDRDLQTLLNHYQDLLEASGVSLADAEIEWTLLKKEIHDEYLSQDKSVPTWKEINRRGNYKHILAVIDLIFTMSPSSSEAERGFSQLKLIKTDLRSKLGQASLNHCLGIKLLSEDIASYDPLPAIDHWNGCGIRSRRPLFQDKKSKTFSVYSYQVVQLDVDNGESIQENAVTQTEPYTVSADTQTASAESETVLAKTQTASTESQTVTVQGSQSDCDSDYDSEIDSDLEEEVVFKKLLDCNNHSYIEISLDFSRE